MFSLLNRVCSQPFSYCIDHTVCISRDIYVIGDIRLSQHVKEGSAVDMKEI